MPSLNLAAAIILASLLMSCANSNPYYDAAKPHHRQDGFQNNYLEFTPKSFGELIRWRYAAWRDDLPKPPQTAPATVAPDLAFVSANAAAGMQMVPAVTFIGHASVLAQQGGLNVLLDPVFSERASPLSFVGPRRFQPPGLSLAQLPHIDLVLVSHNHYDHLDAPSVDALNRQAGGPPLFIVPLGIKPWLGERSITNAVELDWWQSHTLAGPKGPTQITFTPAQHWSSRTPTDRMKTLWGGFAVLSPDFHLFYSGDTGYSRDFSDIKARLADKQTASLGGGFDLALLPVGAYEPRWFMTSQHVNPTEAVQIHRDLGAKQSMGVHWGTFQLTDESLDTPIKDLAVASQAKGLAAGEFFVLAIGETRRLAPRSGSPADLPVDHATTASPASSAGSTSPGSTDAQPAPVAVRAP
ncbi:MBL fold metallo-hydrolase [soil metagenome]